MTGDKNDNKDAYEVGYGKPPRNTRFKKGQSGNPKGRKPRVKNVSVLLANELDRVIVVRDGDGEKKISKREAVITSLVNDAIKGKPTARQALINLLNVTPQPEPLVADQGDDLALQDFLKSMQQNGASARDTPDAEDEDDDGWTG